MTKMTKVVALNMAIETVESAEAKAVLSKMIEQIEAKASKSVVYADKVKAKESAERMEIGKALASAISDEPMTLTQLIKASGLELSTQKAVRCLAEVGVKGEKVKGKVVYALSDSEGMTMAEGLAL